MAAENKVFTEPVRKTLDQLLAESLRENERLRRQVEDAYHERDEYKKLYLGVLAEHAEELTPDDIARAVPARPLIEQAIKRLEQS
jgi:uncharacterized protein YabN with tetrapyrrole methylase and pyrophosphatase domain